MSRRGGICKDNPRERKSGRRDGLGVVGRRASSSLLFRYCLSWKVGDGWSVLGPLFGGSDRERDFEGVLLLSVTVPPAPVAATACIAVSIVFS